MASNPYGSLGPSPATVRRITPPKPRALPGSPNWGQAAEYGWTGSADPNVVTRATQNVYSSPYAGGGGMGQGGGGGRWISPDYSGILSSFTADARARFGAGQQAMEAQRLSQGRSAINRLGIRDVPGMLEKMQAFGLTQADLEQARDNPWSELKAIDQAKDDSWRNTVASRAARGGFRSGGTINARERIDQHAARTEAQYTQDALQQLSEGQFAKANWEREQRDAMEQAIAQQQASLAAAYQPYWQQD